MKSKRDILDLDALGVQGYTYLLGLNGVPFMFLSGASFVQDWRQRCAKSAQSRMETQWIGETERHV